MKKSLFAIAVSLVITATTLLGQHTQSLSFTDPGPITPGSTFTVSVGLMFSGYGSFGFAYWLEVPNALAPFLSITQVSYFTYPDPNQTSPNPAPFNSTAGASPGFMLETRDLGATVSDPNPRPPPIQPYHMTDVTFTLAVGAPLGNFALRSTTLSPRVSEVIDMDFNQNPLPQASVTLNVVPEPSTLALLAFGAASIPLVIRRRKQHN
jgi:hypothetical protein